MTCKEKPKKIEQKLVVGVTKTRITIPASAVGLTLRTSEKTLKEIERLHRETIEAAAKKSDDLIWR